jgi:hypothetical protein
MSMRRTKLGLFDLMFRAPKSVSVVFAIAVEQNSAACIDGHRAAVQAAFWYAEATRASVAGGGMGSDGFAATASSPPRTPSFARRRPAGAHARGGREPGTGGGTVDLAEADGLYEHKSVAGAV